MYTRQVSVSTTAQSFFKIVHFPPLVQTFCMDWPARHGRWRTQQRSDRWRWVVRWPSDALEEHGPSWWRKTAKTASQGWHDTAAFACNEMNEKIKRQSHLKHWKRERERKSLQAEKGHKSARSQDNHCFLWTKGQRGRERWKGNGNWSSDRNRKNTPCRESNLEPQQTQMILCRWATRTGNTPSPSLFSFSTPFKSIKQWQSSTDGCLHWPWTAVAGAILVFRTPRTTANPVHVLVTLWRVLRKVDACKSTSKRKKIELLAVAGETRRRQDYHTCTEHPSDVRMPLIEARRDDVPHKRWAFKRQW